MAISRRRFLEAWGIVSLAAVFPVGRTGIAFGQTKETKQMLGPLAHLPKEALQDPLARLNRMSFYKHIGSIFRFRVDDSDPVDLQLIEVADERPFSYRDSEESMREHFVLTFQGAFDSPLGQNTYTIEHESLGTFQLLVAPNGTQGRYGFNYSATINRMYP